MELEKSECAQERQKGMGAKDGVKPYSSSGISSPSHHSASGDVMHRLFPGLYFTLKRQYLKTENQPCVLEERLKITKSKVLCVPFHPK